jgi:hypothetical protein
LFQYYGLTAGFPIEAIVENLFYIHFALGPIFSQNWAPHTYKRAIHWIFDLRVYGIQSQNTHQHIKQCRDDLVGLTARPNRRKGQKASQIIDTRL